MFRADVDLAAIQTTQEAALGSFLDRIQEFLECREGFQELLLEPAANGLLGLGVGVRVGDGADLFVTGTVEECIVVFRMGR